MLGLRDDLERQDLDLAAGGELGLLGVTREKLAALKGFDRVLISRRGEMIVVGSATTLQAAIRDFSAQLRITVQGRDEPGDVLMPPFFRNIRQAILDEKKDYGAVPPKVEYRLTRKGQSFIPIIDTIRKWGARHLKSAGVGDEAERIAAE
jgi:hypothetical protein